MNKTRIAWTDYTWNPVTGCTPVSEGCTRCYCRALERRFGWPTAVTLHPERLDEPYGKRKGRVFCCSMSDLFHPDVPTEFIRRVFDVMAYCRHLTFQVLTKRPERMLHLLAYGDHLACDSAEHHRLLTMMPLPNVWLGVTAENQARADERIPLLLQVPAAVRFVSVEPMLGPVYLAQWLSLNYRGERRRDGIDWVICGCESGPKRRPMEMDWARWLRDQCQATDVPYFFKQADIGGKVVAEPTLDNRQWHQFPEAAS